MIRISTGLALVAALALSPTPVVASQTDAAGGWADALDRAMRASSEVAFEGRVVIVAFDDHGPSISEIDVAQDPGGELRVGSGETWMVARHETEAFYARAGSLLRLSRGEDAGFDPDRIAMKYEVSVLDQAELDTGAATPIELTERTVDVVRERLFVDEATGLVVRRETFHADGRPQRLVAFTDLRARETAFEAMPGEEEVRGDAMPIDGDRVPILSEVGWMAPDELPGGYVLEGVYALPESDGRSLHLVYGDGLYTLSVYQQRGDLQAGALSGAVADDRHGMHHYRWPGAEPSRMVWSADGLTFTAVTDAPAEHVMAAVVSLPHEAPPSLPRRMVRGLRRVVDALWPFA